VLALVINLAVVIYLVLEICRSRKPS